MKMLLLLLPLFSLAFFSVGCKKESAKQSNQDTFATKHYLVDTLVGNYNTHGSRHQYSIDSPYQSNFVNINNDTISITKMNDSTLMVLNNPVTYVGVSNGAYFFSLYSYYPIGIALYFDTANVNSISLTYTNPQGPGSGTTTTLSGTKIP